MNHLAIDDLTFELRRSGRRETIGITVDRDGSLILHAPARAPQEDVERFAREKRFWIYTKLAEKQLLLAPARERKFVNGEGFFYLGRSYRLLIEPPNASAPPLRLHHGRFRLRRGERDRGRARFIEWYVEHGRPWIQRRVDRYAGRVGVTPRAVEVQDLGYRWGSCGQNGTLHFHWRTILLPPRIIDYLVVHELVHLGEPHHTDDFWRRVERAMPDHAERQRWLAENGAAYDL